MSLKKEVYEHFLLLQTEKINRLRQVLTDLFETAKNETKSTAGDKHETALAHVQIEQQKTRHQLNEHLEQLAVLEKIDPSVQHSNVRKGSLVRTSKNSFFICGGLGKITLATETIFAISPLSPLGAKLMGAEIGAVVEINGVQYEVLEIG